MPAMIERDYFTDHEILVDPYSFFRALHEQAPIFQPPGRDYHVVTGYEETLEILRNHDAFSSAIALQGAGAPLPFPVRCDDISEDIETYRLAFPGGNSIVSLDDDAHTRLRTLVNTLFVPSRLKASEAFIVGYSDDMVRTAVADGGVELIEKIATPFVTAVVADLLGVPVADRPIFMEAIASAPPPGSLDATAEEAVQPFMVMGSYFAGYIADRRANPRDDILSELAHAKYADGTTPTMEDIVQLGMFMFGAGQDTSAKLLGNIMKFLVADQALQDRVRAEPRLIPALIEEVLRLEGSTKQTSRVARRDTSVGGMEFKAGSKFLIALSAANRDPKRWSDPDELRLDRPKAIEQLGFGRGKHVCAGAPLARVEVRVILEKFLEHTARIELDPASHPNGIADLAYEPSFIIRGLAAMHLKLTPCANFIGAPEKSSDRAAPRQYSVRESRIRELLDNPAARAVLDRHFPGMSGDARIEMAKGMTLDAVKAFAPDMFTDAALRALDAELAILG